MVIAVVTGGVLCSSLASQPSAAGRWIVLDTSGGGSPQYSLMEERGGRETERERERERGGGGERDMYNHPNTQQEGTMWSQNHIHVLYMTCESHISKNNKADIHVHIIIIICTCVSALLFL